MNKCMKNNNRFKKLKKRERQKKKKKGKLHRTIKDQHKGGGL